MRFRTHAAAPALAGLALVSACFERPTYGCRDDAQCRVGDVQGFCEDDALCSYGDPSCPSRRRYSPYAGANAEMCVPGSDDGSDGMGTSLGATQGSAGDDDAPTSSMSTSGTEESSTGCGAGCPEPGTQVWSTRAVELGAGRAGGVAVATSGVVITGAVSVGDATAVVLATFDRANGELVSSLPWPSPAGGPDRGRAIAALPAGDLVVAGNETSAAGTERGLLFRVGAGAEVVWTQRLDTLDDDGFAGVAVDESGRAVAVGASGTRAIAFAADETGSTAYSRVFDPPAGASAAALHASAAAAGSGAWVAGSLALSPGSSDLWVRRLNADGGVVLDLRIDDPSDAADAGSAIASLPFGDAIVGGVVAGNAWIARIDTAGAIAFSRAVQDGGTVHGLGVAADGTIIAAGRADEPGHRDAWVAAYGPDGEPMWARTHDGAGFDDEAFGLALDDDVAVVAGYDTDARGESVWLAAYAL